MVELRAEDPWILLAVLYSNRSAGAASLVDLVAAADFINHAIPSLGELDGALSRLRRHGWVTIEDLTFRPTAKAVSMLADRLRWRTSVHTDLQLVRDRLNAPMWGPAASLPRPPRRPRVAGLNQEALDKATDSYRSSARRLTTRQSRPGQP